jgi:hypothetical protein
VLPGVTYYLLAMKRDGTLPPISPSALNPKLRRPAMVPTYYPNVTVLEAAQPFVLRPGEKRENIDFQVARSQAYCIDGSIQGLSGGAFRFQIALQKPHMGPFRDGAFYFPLPGGVTERDGKYRICGLAPGDYQLTVFPDGARDVSSWGTLPVSITNKDVDNVTATAVPRVPVSGEVIWDGPAPDAPIQATLTVSLEPIHRSRRSEPEAKVSIPGEFTFEGGVLMDEYQLEVHGLPAGTYLKDVTYGSRSILRGPFRAGFAMGDSGLKIVVARDGGSVTAKVEDRDGNPVADASVVIIPAVAANEAAVAAAMVTGRTDQNGSWTSRKLAPGNYYAIAVQTEVSRSPEVITQLWSRRNRAKEIKLLPNGAQTVTLNPLPLE